MRICYRCGHRNFFKPGDNVNECQQCFNKIKEVKALTDPSAIKPKVGDTILKKLQHDEYPWEK